jgi:hypothetical protein
MVVHIIQIISAVRSLRHIGSIQIHLALSIDRIFGFGINNPLIPPIGQIIHRCGIADIVAKTKYPTVVNIVRTIYIHTVAKNMGLTVGNVLPGRHIRVENLFFHGILLCIDFETIINK